MLADQRYSITDNVLNQLPADSRPDREQALLTWWRDFRSGQSQGQGLRLSKAGNAAFALAGIESWSFDLTKQFFFSARNFLIMDRKITCPYYLHLGNQPKIQLYGSESAMMLALYQDPVQWVAFLQQT